MIDLEVVLYLFYGKTCIPTTQRIEYMKNCKSNQTPHKITHLIFQTNSINDMFGWEKYNFKLAKTNLNFIQLKTTLPKSNQSFG